MLSVKRPWTVVQHALDAESKNHEAPVLNVTRIEECLHKKSPGKGMDFRSCQILG
jgi:hypothetical protein